MRDSVRSSDGNRRHQKTPNSKTSGMNTLEATASDARLNKLIEDYRAENERCTQKINELKERLKDQ